jgi:hypothetical protein
MHLGVRESETLSDILRDPFWNFLGVVVGILVGIITIGLYFMQRQKKAISFEILSDNALLSVRNEIKSKLQVLYDGKAVKQVYLTLIRIFNSGNVPIQPSDYLQPIEMCFGNNAQILSAEVIESDPKNLDMSLTVEGDKIILKSTLFNKDEYLKIKTLTTESCHQLTVTGRIVGVKQIKKFEGVKFWIYPTIGIGLLMQFAGYFLGSPSLSPALVIVGGIIALFGLRSFRKKMQ